MFNNVVMRKYLSLAEAAELIGKSKETLRRWDKEDILNAVREPGSNYRVYKRSDIQLFMGELLDTSAIDEVSNEVIPKKSMSKIVDWLLNNR